MPYIFVYGTLRKGQLRHDVLEESKFIGYGKLKGYNMYCLGGFPGIIEGSGTVFGEVYQVERRILDKIDFIEGVDYGFYIRKSVTVELESDEKIKAFTYIFNRPVKQTELIPEGDWVKFFEKRNLVTQCLCK